MSSRNIFLDVDTGVDDALALLLAARASQLNVKGVTCVAGNVPIEKVVTNTPVSYTHLTLPASDLV